MLTAGGLEVGVPNLAVDVEKNVSVPLTLTWSGLSVVTEAEAERKCCGLLQGKRGEARSLLDSVTGLARQGEVLAIMGPGGAGKTTLLNSLLSTRGHRLAVSGSRQVNGEEVSPSSLTSVSAYVQQEDLFIPSLTVREHLVFQAKLRQREERVEAVMQQVGLVKVADVLIGNEKLKGISGGEKKRLSFASEFLTNPTILFCDEPTSGLDSFMATSIM